MRPTTSVRVRLCAYSALPPSAFGAGFKAGAKGAHSSRTMMLNDLGAVFAATDATAQRKFYVAVITESNCLGKPTASTRRLSAQRLSELYGLDPEIPLFRVFRRLWDLDPQGRSLLALLMAIARDPLLAATVEPVISLPIGSEFQRDAVREGLQKVTGERLNADTLEKVLRNVASSWTQSGHLSGRTFKRRCLVAPTVHAALLALYLSYLTGFRGVDLFNSGWFMVMDCPPGRARELALEAKRLALIDLRIAGEVVDLKLDRLDPQYDPGGTHGTH